MAFDADPYRTLGLTRDATLDEVRRAYRRLAKANHPDAAGEAALPRFLAIQNAYDTIAGPDAPARRPGVARPPGPRRAWDPDRERTDATYRAYGGRPRRARPTAGSGPARGSPGARPSSERPAADGPTAPRPPRPARPPNKATLGSTSYDGADAEPFEPDWGGASWYGTTSGTYWTLNPKEYADPRKHGPEYQARARRKRGAVDEADASGAAGPTAAETAASDAPAPGSGGPGPEPAAAPRDAADRSPGTGPGVAGPGVAGPATHTTASWWEATAGHEPPSEAATSTRPPRPVRPGRRDRDRPATAASSTGSAPHGTAPGAASAAVLDAVRSWLDDDRPGAIGRIARAVVGWAPIALGIGWVGGEVSGCGRFAAACDDAVVMGAWLVQIAVLVTLLVVARLARISSVATLATLAAAIPGALLLSATGSPDDTAAGRLALSGLLVIAWVVGLAFGTVRELRGTSPEGSEPPGVRGPGRPVS